MEPCSTIFGGIVVPLIRIFNNLSRELNGFRCKMLEGPATTWKLSNLKWTKVVKMMEKQMRLVFLVLKTFVADTRSLFILIVLQSLLFLIIFNLLYISCRCRRIQAPSGATEMYICIHNSSPYRPIGTGGVGIPWEYGLLSNKNGCRPERNYQGGWHFEFIWLLQPIPMYWITLALRRATECFTMRELIIAINTHVCSISLSTQPLNSRNKSAFWVQFKA